MNVDETHTELLSSISGKVSLGGAGGAIVFGYTANEIGMYAGVIIGLAGLAIKWYYAHQTFKLQQRESRFKRRESDV